MESNRRNLEIFLTNSLTNQKELFVPINKNKVLMYVCGITPYDYAHLGHGRCYVTFDLLYRLLSLFDYEVVYCRNFTDVDDKLINRAIQDRNNPHDYIKIASEFINKFHEDMIKLNCLPPTYEPRVTDNIPTIINFITKLINNNKAYNVDGNIYYSIDSCPTYGKLSNRSLENLKAGARIEIREEKKSPLDFALWKKSNNNIAITPHIASSDIISSGNGTNTANITEAGAVNYARGPEANNSSGAIMSSSTNIPVSGDSNTSEDGSAVGWNSPWSFGRPGWHIECSALIRKYLGSSIDIHGGGMDLIFPHHENEIAQSEGLSDCSSPLANYWVHNAFVEVNKEKMSKSLNNFVKLNDLFEHYDPMAVRYYYLQHHYRIPLDFSTHDLEAASKAYNKLCLFFEKLDDQNQEFSPAEAPLLESLIGAIADDLNCAKFFGIIFDNLKKIEQDVAQATFIKILIKQLLGLDLKPIFVKELVITPEIQNLLDQREAARASKDWALADKLRAELKALGYEFHDKKI